MLVPSSRNWFARSVLGQSADSYIDYLRSHGYCDGTVQAHGSSVSHFAYWLTKCRIQLAQIDEALVHQFVKEHLPACDGPGRWQRRAVEMRAALVHLLSVLRAENRIPAACTQVSPAVHSELQCFESFLAETCGLAPASRMSRLSWVSKMLRNRFGRAPIDLGQIDPRDIVDFMVRPDDSYRPGSMQVIASALRSYLRFRSLQYGDDVQRLLAAVPSGPWPRSPRTSRRRKSHDSSSRLINTACPDFAATRWRGASWTWDYAPARWPPSNWMT